MSEELNDPVCASSERSTTWSTLSVFMLNIFLGALAFLILKELDRSSLFERLLLLLGAVLGVEFFAGVGLTFIKKHASLGAGLVLGSVLSAGTMIVLAAGGFCLTFRIR